MAPNTALSQASHPLNLTHRRSRLNRSCGNVRTSPGQVLNTCTFVLNMRALPRKPNQTRKNVQISTDTFAPQTMDGWPPMGWEARTSQVASSG
jgi:hypothetical protein